MTGDRADLERDAAAPPGPSPSEAPHLVDWSLIGRRLRWTAVTLLAAAIGSWVLVGALGSGLRLADVWGYVGLAFVGMFVVEVVVVGGSAVRGLLRAGERGERLAGDDVGLLPPQLGRRRSDPDRPGT